MKTRIELIKLLKKGKYTIDKKLKKALEGELRAHQKIFEKERVTPLKALCSVIGAYNLEKEAGIITKKVYCENCKYVKRMKTRIGVLYYCNLPERIKNYASGNLKHNCNFYKKKWWKFWIKESKRKILKGAQSKTDPGLEYDTILIDDLISKEKRPKHTEPPPKPEIIPSITLEKYLDKCIRFWRKILKKTNNKEQKLIAECNIDAFQSVRVSILGKPLPEEEK